MSAILEADRRHLRKAIEQVGAVRVHLKALILTARPTALEGMADVLLTALWRALEDPQGWPCADAAPASSTHKK